MRQGSVRQANLREALRLTTLDSEMCVTIDAATHPLRLAVFVENAEAIAILSFLCSLILSFSSIVIVKSLTALGLTAAITCVDNVHLHCLPLSQHIRRRLVSKSLSFLSGTLKGNRRKSPCLAVFPKVEGKATNSAEHLDVEVQD